MPERRPRPAGVRGSTIDVGGWVSQGCASNITRREAKQREQGCTRGHARTSVVSGQVGNVVGGGRTFQLGCEQLRPTTVHDRRCNNWRPSDRSATGFAPTTDDRRPTASYLEATVSRFNIPGCAARVPDDPPIWPRPFLSFHGLLNAITRHRGALPGPGFRLEIRPPRVSKT